MKILDRYVGGSILLSTIFGVLILSLVLVLGNLFKELLDLLINRDVPIMSVLAFMMYVLPFSMTFTIPWGFLTAVLLVFGRLSADNEIIAFRANGVSIQRICFPVFGLAALLSGICLYINLEVAPRAEMAMKNIIFDMATSNPSTLFAADEVVSEFPNRRIYVGGKEDDKLYNIIMFELNDDDHVVKMIHAKEGKLESDPENARLLLKLYDANFEQRDEKDPANISKVRQGIELKEGVFPISLEDLYEKHSTKRRTSTYTFPELLDGIRKNAFEEMLPAKVEANRRFSSAMACLAFALIAVPLGITAHRRETSVGFAFSLVIAFTYFFFIIMAETFKNEAAAFPLVLIWIPNVLFITLGIWLFRRLMKQ
ncbi:MAG: LptF/LptG family permease [Chthoniobacterales bacterium]